MGRSGDPPGKATQRNSRTDQPSDAIEFLLCDTCLIRPAWGAMKSKEVLMTALLTFSLLAPLQLSIPASAESSDVLAKGNLVKPGKGGTPRLTYCPPSMAAAGITIFSLPGYNAADSVILYDLRIECIDQAMLDKGVTFYTPYTKFYGQVATLAEKKGDKVRTFLCPEGSLLTGLRMATTSYIQDISPVCGNPETGETTLDSKLGSSQGKPLTSESICPMVSGKSTYVVGLDGFTGAGVDAVQVLCGRTLKSNSKITLPSEKVLLAQYLPRGAIGTGDSLQASSVNPYVNFSALDQIGGDGTANTDVFPFKTTIGQIPGDDHYFRFYVTPASPNVFIKVTQVTYSSLSYAVGTGTGNQKITGNSANYMYINARNESVNTWAPIISISPTNDSRLFEFSKDNLSAIPSVKERTEFHVGFVGATGYQYNDLSGRNGATGMMIYGQLIDMSPVVPEVTAETKAPDAPINFTFFALQNTAMVTVDVPKSLLSEVKQVSFTLSSPELGFPEGKRLKGSVTNGKVYFKFKIDDIHFGKIVNFKINSIQDSVDSAPLLMSFRVPPKETTASTPKPTASSKSAPKSTPKVVPPKATTVKCVKAGVTRVFTSTSCPPGYKKQ